jgi:hypothetical protein
MKLKLQRIYFKDTYTVGKLFVDDVYFSDTIEDKYRDLSKEKKVYGQTAIPAGIYKVILSMSAKYKKIMPEVLNVPQFEGIRIHSGNTAEDSEGCIIVGRNKIKGKVIDSKITMEKLMEKLEGQKDISLTIYL